jgi:hypothetical protein
MSNDPTPWWESPDHNVASAVVSRATEIKSSRSIGDRYERYERAFELYNADHGPEGLRQNVTAEAVDALASELTQSPIRVVITARALDYDDRQKAKMWEWYADAAFTRHRLPHLQYQMAKDAIIAGIGAFVIVDTEEGPRPERVHPKNLLVDDAGCIDVEPPELLIRHCVSRWRLAQDYPDHAEAIKNAPTMDERGRDAMEVFTAWFDGGEDGKGRHVVALRGVEAALLDEEWDGRPPWGYVRIVPADEGLVGRSLVLRAESQQLEHDRLTKFIQDASAAAAPYTFYEQAAMVNPDHFENEPNLRIPMLKPPGTAVLRLTPEAVHPENYARLNSLRQGIFSTMQANDLFAAGEIPKGLESGKAIRNYREVRSRRHLPTQRELEWGAEQLVWELFRGEQRAQENNPGHRIDIYIAGTINTLALNTLALSEMLTDEDQIQIQAKAASALPLEPGVRIEMLQELVEANLLSQAEFFELSSDVIDFEVARRRITAPNRFIENEYCEMLKTGEGRKPPKFIDKKLALEMGLAAIQDAQLEGAPEERLAVVRAYLDELGAQITDEAKAVAAAQAPPPGPPPMAAPGAPPPDLGAGGPPPPMADMPPGPPPPMPPGGP